MLMISDCRTRIDEYITPGMYLAMKVGWLITLWYTNEGYQRVGASVIVVPNWLMCYFGYPLKLRRLRTYLVVGIGIVIRWRSHIKFFAGVAKAHCDNKKCFGEIVIFSNTNENPYLASIAVWPCTNCPFGMTSDKSCLVARYFISLWAVNIK